MFKGARQDEHVGIARKVPPVGLLGRLAPACGNASKVWKSVGTMWPVLAGGIFVAGGTGRAGESLLDV